MRAFEQSWVVIAGVGSGPIAAEFFSYFICCLVEIDHGYEKDSNCCCCTEDSKLSKVASGTRICLRRTMPLVIPQHNVELFFSSFSI